MIYANSFTQYKFGQVYSNAAGGPTIRKFDGSSVDPNKYAMSVIPDGAGGARIRTVSGPESYFGWHRSMIRFPELEGTQFGDVRVLYRWRSVPGGALDRGGIFTRASSAGYLCVRFAGNDAEPQQRYVAARVYESQAGQDGNIGALFPWVYGAEYWVLVHDLPSEGRLRVKVWRYGDLEPSLWLIDQVQDWPYTALAASGEVGLLVPSEAGWGAAQMGTEEWGFFGIASGEDDAVPVAPTARALVGGGR